MSFSLRRIFASELMFWVAICILGLYLIYPLRQSLRFGIDLVGGTYLTLEVQTDKAVESELIERMQSIDAILQRSKLKIPESKYVKDNTIMVQFASIQDAQLAAAQLKQGLEGMNDAVDGSLVKLSLPASVVEKIKEDAVERNIEVLRIRMGADTPIAAQGSKNIVVELPDTANPQEAKARIGKAAQLELKLVEAFAANQGDLLLDFDGELPPDKEIVPDRDTRGGFYLVDKYSDITGKLLKDARAKMGGQSGMDYVVAFKFNDTGAERFYQLTSKHYGRRLAVVLDGVVITAPNITEPISGGEGVISGSFTAESSRDLALLLNSGSFVAPVKFEEERQIGPSLGQESINQGLMSCLVGLGLLFLFSLFYYKLSGLFAFIALIYNLILVLVGLAWLQLPLTLPGIAGMVLTVGMAIDASILIYEHIREELEKGVGVRDAVDRGFSGAMWVILDANITNFITGVVLFWFGTGPIQGFAVTMMLGIVATLITGLFFLRSLFKFFINNFHIKNIGI